MTVNHPHRGLAFLLLAGGLLFAVGCEPSVTSDSPVATVDSQPAVAPQVAVATVASPDAAKDACCEGPMAENPSLETADVDVQQLTRGIGLPNVALINQEGESVQFSEVVQGKIVVMNFVFTTCKGICPPMGANFAALQRQLGTRDAGQVALVSVSVDPTIDTPQRLKAWRDKFEGGPDWTLLTGAKRNIETLLKELEVFTADKNDHSPFILIGDEAAGTWSRVHGLTSPDKLAEIIAGLQAASPTVREQSSIQVAAASENIEDAAAGVAPSIVDPNPAPSGQAAPGQAASGQAEPKNSNEEQVKQIPPAEKYFTDVELVNQHGEKMRLYSDVLKGKVVVINSFFSTCKGSCPVMMASFAKIQEEFADRLGKDLFMISITVDPKTDTPDVLASYADQWQAKPGWYFLTGEKTNVDTAAYKLGQYVKNRESHNNIFIIGNEATGLWKKAKGLSKAEALFPLIEEVLNDTI